jgi:uncharacterized repeat protein (TIGR03803 family)
MKFALTPLSLVFLALTSFAEAQTFNQIYSFQGGSDGGNPFSNVVADTAGNFYGTTFSGGNLSTCAYPGCGVVYKVDSSGNETPLYTFSGPPSDGANPVAGVIRDAAGNMYGTTAYGGANGYGTVFEVDSAGVETVLRTFTGGADGGIPNGGLIRDQAGNLYGTTYAGGSAEFGTVFKITAAGVFQRLYSFPDRAHGTNPNAALLRDNAGNLYGITQYGGAANRGTVFELDAAGNETVLYSFLGSPDGAYPQSQLVRDSAGNFYGTTTEGGSSNNGSVFKLAAAGAETVIYSFGGSSSGTSGGSSDGSYPTAGVVIDAAGNLYGTTFRGGTSSNAGTVFKIDPLGQESLLYTFQGSFDGSSPAASLILNQNATSVYGTGESGGFACCGVVFQVTLQ